MTTDSTINFRPDDRRRVYALRVTLTVECDLHILAHSEWHAKERAKLIDLHDYFGFTPDCLSTDHESLLRIKDVTVVNLPVDLRELSLTEYPPNQHPDYIGGGRAWRK